MMMERFVSGFLLSLSLCLDLGIVNVAVVKTGLERGVLPSFLVGLGSSFGDLIYALLSMVGMSLLMQFTVVRWMTGFSNRFHKLFCWGRWSDAR
jgi:L-lysine exporter family protein LysE/ArgO